MRYVRGQRCHHAIRLTGKFKTSQTLLLVALKAKEMYQPENLRRAERNKQLERAVAKADGREKVIARAAAQLRYAAQRPMRSKLEIQIGEFFRSGRHGISRRIGERVGRRFPASKARFAVVSDVLDLKVQPLVGLPCLAQIPSALDVAGDVLVDDDQPGLVQETIGGDHLAKKALFRAHDLVIISEKEQKLEITNSEAEAPCKHGI